MADHLDAPGLKSPAPGDARTDITDIYAFQKPGNPNKSILMLNVNPLAPTLATAFDPEAVYQLNVDTNGDSIADRVFEITFDEPEDGEQEAEVRLRVLGAKDDEDEEQEGKEIIEDAPVSFGRAARVTTNGPFKFFAGIRSDPFFFDLVGFLSFVKGQGFDFTHGDFFADKNVFGIVLEVPNSALGSNPHVGIWGRTKVRVAQSHEHHHLVNDDRMGRPAINTVFNHGDDKNTFNQTEPAQDRTAVTADGPTFVESFRDTIIALSTLGTTLGGKGAYDPATATTIARILLPDILTYDFSDPSGFLNGRKLTDDVINAELGLLTNGSTLTDDAAAHGDLLPAFPFLGPPH